MSKQSDDLIDRVLGAATALRGVRAKLTPVPTLQPVEVMSTPPQGPQEVTQEDYAYAKKVIADMKAQLEALEAEVARESKVPEHGGPAADEHKSRASSAGSSRT